MSRLPYVDKADVPPEYHEYLVSSLQPGRALHVYRAIGNNPAVLEGMRQFLSTLWTDSGLSDRHREIVILTTSSELASEYEWHQHVRIATESDLLETETIAAIARDSREPLTDRESVLVAYTRAVIRGRVTDSLHEAVLAYFDPDAVVGIAATASGYLGLARMIDAFEVEIEDPDDAKTFEYGRSA